MKEIDSHKTCSCHIASHEYETLTFHNMRNSGGKYVDKQYFTNTEAVVSYSAMI